MRVLIEDTLLAVTVGDTVFVGSPVTGTQRSVLFAKVQAANKGRNEKKTAGIFRQEHFAATVSDWYAAKDEEGHDVEDGGMRDVSGAAVSYSKDAARNIAERNPTRADEILAAFDNLSRDNTEVVKGES